MSEPHDDVPEHLERVPVAQESLAKRFGLPYSPPMQDWEIEVANPSRIDEFLQEFEELSEDERFTLMWTIIQSFEEGEVAPERDSRWQRVLAILDRDIEVHISTVWYWACPTANDPGAMFRVTPSIRPVLAKHRQRFERVHDRE